MSKSLAFNKNILVPILDELVNSIPDPSVRLQVKGVWATLKFSYLLYADVLPNESAKFMKKIKKNINNIQGELMKSSEFQQSLLLTFETLLRTREEEKRKVIETVFLCGFIASLDRQKFYLERFYRVAQEISIAGLEHLNFISKTIFPLKEKIIREEVAKMNKQNRDNDDEWWYKLEYYRKPDSEVIQLWIHDEYDANSPKVKAYAPPENTNEWKKWMNQIGDKKRQIENNFAEITSELLSLGIFRSIATYNGNAYTLTAFGREFIEYKGMSFLEEQTNNNK